MRLDLFLVSNGFTVSRSEAVRVIRAGGVLLRGIPVTKPAFDVSDADIPDLILDRSSIRYVSRGGLKLDGALCAFDLDVAGRQCIDVGASTGGFTDCLLQHGASRVICVDSGTDQLAEKLRADDRVTVLENFNARFMEPTDFPFVPDLAVMDVSFISATLLIAPLSHVLAPGADFICLVKPQFEVGRAAIGKGGIVKSEKAREAAVASVTSFAERVGFHTLGVIPSPITGTDGNVEYLVHFRKERT